MHVGLVRFYFSGKWTGEYREKGEIVFGDKE